MGSQVVEPGVSAIPVTLLATAAGGVMFSAPCVLLGWQVNNKSATILAGLAIYDGLNATGQVVASLSMPTASSTAQQWGPVGIRLQTGLYAQVTAGTLDVIAYVVPLLTALP